MRHRALGILAKRYETLAPKGEIVIVVGPPEDVPEASDEAIDTALDAALSKFSVSRAAAQVAKQLNVSKKRAYARALDRTK